MVDGASLPELTRKSPFGSMSTYKMYKCIRHPRTRGQSLYRGVISKWQRHFSRDRLLKLACDELVENLRLLSERILGVLYLPGPEVNEETVQVRVNAALGQEMPIDLARGLSADCATRIDWFDTHLDGHAVRWRVGYADKEAMAGGT